MPRPPPPADPPPTEALPAEEAALDPELTAAGALVDTEGPEDMVPEYPPELPPIGTTGPAEGAGIALPQQDTAPPHDPLPQQPVIQVAAAGDAGRWAEDTAQKVATLCTRADASFAHWSVILPLDAQALPETDLMLSMSPYGLSLRFRTQSSLSSQLINTHKPRLQALLGRTRGLPRDIDIEVT